MRGRIALFFVLNFMIVFIPANISVAEDIPSWRLNGLDPDLWTDGPVEEDTPMNMSYPGQRSSSHRGYLPLAYFLLKQQVV